MIRIFTRQIEKLGTEDGQALIFVALVGLVIFLFFSVTMNVADLVNTKIKNQNVADAAALSAAVWQARTLNLVAAANQNLMEQWVFFLGFFGGTIVLTLGCTMACGELSIDLIPCIACLAAAAILGLIATSSFGATLVNGSFQDSVLQAVDMNVVYPDLDEFVVPQNYAFKENTRSDDVGLYLHYPTTADALLRAYVPGDQEVGDYALERVGLCAAMVMAARYGNYLWHVTDEEIGISDDVWETQVQPVFEEWYSEGGQCYEQYDMPTNLPPEAAAVLPLALRSRDASWNLQDLDSILAMTVATFKAQEPPPALGKGSDSANCTWREGDTRFPCPNIRHYAFASAHAYSSSAAEFYNTLMVGLSDSYLIPYVPFVMDWEPRLFPVDGQAYLDLADMIQADGFPGDREVLVNNLLQLNGSDYFLY